MLGGNLGSLLYGDVSVMIRSQARQIDANVVVLLLLFFGGGGFCCFFLCFLLLLFYSV